MKKLLALLSICILMAYGAYAQSAQNRRTVDVGSVTSRAWERGGAHKGFYMYKDGSVNYYNQNSRGDTTEEKKGTYYIDERNIIYITWENGFQQKATISYSSNGKAIIYYNGYNYYEAYSE